MIYDCLNINKPGTPGVCFDTTDELLVCVVEIFLSGFLNHENLSQNLSFWWAKRRNKFGYLLKKMLPSLWNLTEWFNLQIYISANNIDFHSANLPYNVLHLVLLHTIHLCPIYIGLVLDVWIFYNHSEKFNKNWMMSD